MAEQVWMSEGQLVGDKGQSIPTGGVVASPGAPAASDAAVVHLAGVETITGQKIISATGGSLLQISSLSTTDVPLDIRPKSGSTGNAIAVHNGGAGFNFRVDFKGGICIGPGKMGTAVLVGGTVTVNNQSVTATSLILLTHQVVGGTIGILSVGTITPGVSFVINSSNAADTSTVLWMILEPS